jgi:predicted Zn-dependent protease
MQWLAVMAVYRDRVAYGEQVTQIAYRDGSIEINSLSASVGSVRVNKDGCWYIVSKQGVNVNFDEMERRALSITEARICGELAEAELFKGTVDIGRELPEEEEVAALVRDLCQEVSASYSVKCEAVVTLHEAVRALIRENGEEARERKKLVELEAGLLGTAHYGYQLFSSEYIALVAWSKQHVLKAIDSVFRETASKLSKGIAVKTLKPYEVGRATIILSGIASAALIHEISHLLNPLYPGSSRLLGQKLFPEGFELYDDPLAPEAPSIRFFDDEGVATRRRTLVEEGVIRDLHHTRTTSKAFSSEPGSAYGLFTRPTPFHTALVLKHGDWSDKEILEETKRGFLVEGVTMATLEEGYIRIVPQYSFVIEGGEIREAVRVREIKIPLAMLKTVSAISKNPKARASVEKSWIVTEIAPRIRLEGYVS